MSQPTPFEFSSPSSYLLHALATARPPARPIVSRSARRVGLVISAIPSLFLAMDLSMKLLRVDAAVQGTTQLGYPPSVLVPLGLLQLGCLLLYLTRRTAVLGAVLWTGYLGGAVATHVRLSNPLVTHVSFPVLVGALLWLGLWLRDERVRALLS